MRIKHDLALFDVTIFLEKTGDLLFGKARVDTSNEQIGSWVDSTIILGRTTIILRRATVDLLAPLTCERDRTQTEYRPDHCRLGKQNGEHHLEGYRFAG